MSNSGNHFRYHCLFLLFAVVGVIPSCMAFMTQSGTTSTLSVYQSLWKPPTTTTIIRRRRRRKGRIEMVRNEDENYTNGNRNNNGNSGFVNGVVNSANGYVNGSKEYSRLLVKRKDRKEKRVEQQQFINRLLNKGGTLNSYMDEDGYGTMMKRKNRSLTRTFMRAPFTLVKRIIFPEIAKEPGTLILVRHGESEWNSNKTFTGWADPDLSERGYREIEYAAR